MNTISDDEIIKSAIKLVNEGLRVTFPVKGYSMLPFIIGGKESVDLVKPIDIQVGHVVLAWVEGCRYVVHRIIQIDGDKVVLMGDGNIAGVVTPKGKHNNLYSPWRIKASHLWWRLLPIRRWILAIYRRTWLKIMS